MCPSTSLPAPHASTKCLVQSLAGAAAVTLLLCGTAHAAGSGMPWEQPLEQVLLSVQGPVARIVAVDRKSTTSELQSLMRISYAVFCLKKKTRETNIYIPHNN